jgi:hypothetical protein
VDLDLADHTERGQAIGEYRGRNRREHPFQRLFDPRPGRRSQPHAPDGRALGCRPAIEEQRAAIGKRSPSHQSAARVEAVGDDVPAPGQASERGPGLGDPAETVANEAPRLARIVHAADPCPLVQISRQDRPVPIERPPQPAGSIVLEPDRDPGAVGRCGDPTARVVFDRPQAMIGKTLDDSLSEIVDDDRSTIAPVDAYETIDPEADAERRGHRRTGRRDQVRTFAINCPRTVPLPSTMTRVVRPSGSSIAASRPSAP